jgi:hypothetical protein
MKLILDTNIWRYLVESKNKNNLYKCTQDFKCEILVPPAIVIETLRMGDRKLRKKIVELQTRDCWKRLMPDAFLQSQDWMAELLRLHPEWGKKSPDTSNKRRLQYDWIRKKGGFWEKARKNTDAMSEKYYLKDSKTLAIAQKQSKDVRSAVLQDNKKEKETQSLSTLTGSWTNLVGEEVEMDAWRVYSELIWTNMLRDKKSPFWEWTQEEINLELILLDYYPQFLEFWRDEADVKKLPREWIRTALYFLQGKHKVTNGNPVDSTISVHLVDADLIASADRNFVSIANQIRGAAPFKTARGVLLEAGNDGVDNLFRMMKINFEST